MPVKARGIVFTAPGEVALERFELPDPGPQQVLVRTTRTLVSAGTEVKALLNVRESASGAGQATRYPVRPGYSSVGVVEAVGDSVDAVRLGDRILTMGRHATHTLVDLRPKHNPIAGQEAPAYLQKVPDGVADDQAVFAILGSVALHGMRKVSFQLGESCAVLGQGVVGQLLGQLVRAAGAAPVIGIDLVPSRLEQAKVGGIHAVIDAAHEDVEAAVLRLTGGRGADVCFEATRSPQNFPTLMRVAALAGRIVVVGSLPGTVEISLYDEIQRKELTIIGAWQPRAPVAPHASFPWSQQRNRETFLELLRVGTVRVDHLITRRGQAEDAPRLYGEIGAGPGDWLGVMFQWSDG
jgi:2-desacetyl-2-hydroxyethyl bacteriochlorophyllide A dehydrogenase